jgi:hypothetical protein
MAKAGSFKKVVRRHIEAGVNAYRRHVEFTGDEIPIRSGDVRTAVCLGR